MRRYDALSHNSYLHPIDSFGDIEDRAAHPSGAYTAENGMVGETEQGPCFLGG